MKKKFVIGIFLLLILFVVIMKFPYFMDESKKIYIQKLPNVKIKETFSGNADDVIDEFIVKYIESSDFRYDDFTSSFVLIPSKHKYNEFETVVHHTFDTKTSGNEITYYIAYKCVDGNFINEIFGCDVSGNVPASITLKKVKGIENQYKVTKFLFQKEGHLYCCPIEEIFDNKIIIEYQAENYNRELTKKLHKKERAYLKSVGKDVKIVYDYDLNDIMEDTEFIESGYDYLEDEGDFIENFNDKGYPDWIGTRERLEKGEWYIYKAEQKEKDKGEYIVTYTKTDESGNILEQYKVNANSKGYEVKKVV